MVTPASRFPEINQHHSNALETRPCGDCGHRTKLTNMLWATDQLEVQRNKCKEHVALQTTRMIRHGTIAFIFPELRPLPNEAFTNHYDPVACLMAACCRCERRADCWRQPLPCYIAKLSCCKWTSRPSAFRVWGGETRNCILVKVAFLAPGIFEFLICVVVMGG